MTALAIISAYLLACLVLGLLKLRSGPDRGPAGFALAGRSLKPALLFATMAATNFSAFTVFGLCGAGYRIGWAYYPIMAFGTGLMAVSFLIIGIPMRRMSAEKGWISPGDFIRDRFGSPALAKGFSAWQILLTIPYLAVQAVAAGRLLEIACGIPYWSGCLITVAIVCAYTLRGGMKSVAWTDTLQLALLVIGAGLAFAWIFTKAGGPSGASSRLLSMGSSLLSRDGGGQAGLVALAGSYILWCLADPMFPQLFQRFYGAKDDAALERTATLYPLVTGGLFFVTIGCGIAAASLLPGLNAKEAEQALQLVAVSEGADWVAALFSMAALAALMSTMDSQLLSVATIVGSDFLPDRLKGRRADRFLVGAFSLAAFMTALVPPESILDFLVSTAFPGYAALAPIVLVGLYDRRAEKRGAAAALCAGVVLVILETAGLIQTGPLPKPAFNALVQALILLTARIANHEEKATTLRLADIAPPLWLALIGLLVVGSLEPWAFGWDEALMLGLPPFVLRSAACCALLSALFASRGFFVKRRKGMGMGVKVR